MFIVDVVQQSDVGGVVWIVFDVFYVCWDVQFVVFEVDDVVVLFGIIIDVMYGDVIVVVMII